MPWKREIRFRQQISHSSLLLCIKRRHRFSWIFYRNSDGQKANGPSCSIFTQFEQREVLSIHLIFDKTGEILANFLHNSPAKCHDKFCKRWNNDEKRQRDEDWIGLHWNAHFSADCASRLGRFYNKTCSHFRSLIAQLSVSKFGYQRVERSREAEFRSNLLEGPNSNNNSKTDWKQWVKISLAMPPISVFARRASTTKEFPCCQGGRRKKTGKRTFTTNGMCVKKNTTYTWHEKAIIEWSWHVISIVACCHSMKLCAYAAQDFPSQHMGALGFGNWAQ